MDYPTFLPGWETVERIGKGGFSIVYKIKQADEILGDVYSALKVIKIPHDEDEYRHYELEGYDDASIKTIFKGQVNNIVAESEIMFKFRGAPNIVNFESHKVIETDTGFMVLIKMELLEPLLEYNKRHPLDEVAIVKLGMSICEALKLCSEEKIVHRDIKPLNIFVDKFNNFKLGDFGIARVMDHTTRATKIGTLTYVAPEVYGGKPYNNKTDIYSLGLVLYWFLNELRLPFLPLPPAIPTPSENESACARRLNGEQLSPPVNGCDQLKRVVLKACAVDPEDRYSSADEFYDDLDDVRSALRRGKATYTGNIDLPDEVKIATPSEEGKIATPSDEVKIATPSDEVKIATPSEEVKIATPSEEDKIATPSEEDKIATPSDEVKIATPSDEVKIATPSEEGKIATPSEEGKNMGESGEKNNPETPLPGSKVIDTPNPNHESTVPLTIDSMISANTPLREKKPSNNALNGATQIQTVQGGKSKRDPDKVAPDFAWSIADGTLTISGHGDMPYYSENNAPWYFKSGEIKSAVISDGITSIGSYAFYFCDNLTSVTIPKSVSNIGKDAFYACECLAEIKYTGTKEQWEAISKSDGWDKYTGNYTVLYNQNPNNTSQPPQSSKIESTKYNPDKVAPDFTWSISDGTLTISGHGKMPDYSDDNNKAPWYSKRREIKSAVISDGVTSIGDCAFYFCEYLTSITIPNSVKTIGNWAFYLCKNLTSVTIPHSVTTIGACAFLFCNNLKSINVDISNAIYTSVDGVLFTKNKTKLIAYPTGKSGINFTISNSVTSISDHAFNQCENLISLTIPESVTYIGACAFSSCKKLASITIPSSVMVIGEYAFCDCISLTEIKYTGTKAQWKGIIKGTGWKKGTDSFKVICNDTTISKFFA